MRFIRKLVSINYCSGGLVQNSMKLRLLEHLEEEPRKRVAFAPSSSSSSAAATLPAARVDASVFDVAPPGYDNGTGFLPVPGFTDQMRQQVPRADGRPGYRPADAAFGPAWAEEHQFREYLFRRNKIYRFAQQVGGVAGITVDLWKSSEGAIEGAALENLVQSAVAADANSAPGLDLPRDYQKELNEALMNTTEVNDADKISLLQMLRQRETAENAIAKRGGADLTDSQFLSTGARLAAEKEARDKAARDAKLPAVSPSLRPSASAATGRTAIPSGGTADVTESADGVQLQNSRPRAYQTLVRDLADDELKPRDTTPVTGRDEAAQEVEKAKLARAEVIRDTAPGLATLDANNNIVYDVNNKWAMALRLMLSNPTATQLEIWRIIYDEPKRDESRRGAGALTASGKPLMTQVRELLSERSAIEAILSRGQGGRNSALAPQNVGSLYFGATLTAGVNMAVQYIRGPLCGYKTWVTDLDLMTHDRVWIDFAQLVATCIRINQSTASRYGDMTRSLRGVGGLEWQRSMQLQKFATLRMMLDGFLGFDGEYSILDEQTRHTTLLTRERTLLETGNYRSNRFES
jgi:hypothetical protein